MAGYDPGAAVACRPRLIFPPLLLRPVVTSKEAAERIAPCARRPVSRAPARVGFGDLRCEVPSSRYHEYWVCI
jgi:hypothetical protein